MRLLFLIFALISVGVILESCTSGNAQVTQKPGANEMHILTPGTFEKKLAETPGAQLVDVREADELKAGYIEGAINIDYHAEEFEERLEKMLEKNKPVFVYCMGGGRSAKSAIVLREIGFQNVYQMDGGFSAWEATGKPVVK